MNEDDIIRMNFEIIRDVEKRVWSIFTIYLVVMSLLLIGYEAIDSLKPLLCVSGFLISLSLGLIGYLFRKRYLNLISDFEKTYKDSDKLLLKKHWCYEKKVACLLFILFVVANCLWISLLIFSL